MPLISFIFYWIKYTFYMIQILPVEKMYVLSDTGYHLSLLWDCSVFIWTLTFCFMFDFFVWTTVLDKLVYNLGLVLRWEMWPRGLLVEIQMNMTFKQDICFMVLGCVLKLRQIVSTCKICWYINDIVTEYFFYLTLHLKPVNIIFANQASDSLTLITTLADLVKVS